MRKRDRRRNEKTWTIKIDKISRHLVSAVIILLGTVIAQKLWEKYGRAARKRKRESLAFTSLTLHRESVL